VLEKVQLQVIVIVTNQKCLAIEPVLAITLVEHACKCQRRLGDDDDRTECRCRHDSDE
jgi:hypothetical protein